MKKIFIIPLVLSLTVLLGSCANSDNNNGSTSATESTREVEPAFKYIYETGSGYNGELSALEINTCINSLDLIHSTDSTEVSFPYHQKPGIYLWDPSTPSVKMKGWYNNIKRLVKAGDPDAIGEVSSMLALLIQAYHPDKVGFMVRFDLLTNETGLTLVGDGNDTVMSWDQIISQLDLHNEPGIAELAGLLKGKNDKIDIRFVKNSTEQLCKAYRGFQNDISNNWDLNETNHKFLYDVEKDMINFQLREDAKEYHCGCLITNPSKPFRLADVTTQVTDFTGVIHNKYPGLMYYSEYPATQPEPQP